METSGTEKMAAMLSLFENGLFSDVTFIVGNCENIFRGHKAILYSSSEYFQAMLKPGSLMESRENTIRLPCVSFDRFLQLMEFVYTGQLRGFGDLHVLVLEELYTLADEFLLENLKEACATALEAHLHENLVAYVQIVRIDYYYGRSGNILELFVPALECSFNGAAGK
jgi:hypothetical protein